MKIATDIEENYLQYDGFVVIMGTDTMAYASSAMSFMLENLGKTVVFTGSQVSYFIFIDRMVKSLKYSTT